MTERVPIGFERYEPGSAWGDITYSDGSKDSVPDPDGSIEEEVRGMSARYNARGPVAPATIPELATPPLSGAAGAQIEPPPDPPMPATAPLTPMEMAPLQPTPAEMGALGAPAVPATTESPAAAAVAEMGVAPPQRSGNPAEDAVRGLGMGGLLPSGATVQTTGPDPAQANVVRGVGDTVLGMRAQSINQGTQAASDTLTAGMQQDVAAYMGAKNAEFAQMGQNAANEQAREGVKEKLLLTRQKPIDPDRLFNDASAPFIILSIIQGIAGAVAEISSHGKRKSTWGEDMWKLIDMDMNLQREQKSGMIAQYENELGSVDAAILRGKAELKEHVAEQAVQAQRYAKTADAYRNLGALSTEAKAAALEDRNKLESTLIGQSATSLQLAAPKPGAGGKGVGLVNPETAEEQAVLKANGVDDKSYRKYGDERLKTGADAFISSADNADAIVNKLASGQDVPGSGPLDKILQPFARGEDAAAVQQVTGFLTAQFGKMISGASMTEAERANLNKIVEGRGTLADWKRGIATLRTFANSQLETLNNTYTGEGRAFDQIKGMRGGRKSLSADQQSRKALQGKTAAPSTEDQSMASEEGGMSIAPEPEAPPEKPKRKQGSMF